MHHEDYVPLAAMKPRLRAQTSKRKNKMKEFNKLFEEVTGKDLRAALDALLNKANPVAHQKPSMGCGIKWK